MYTTHVHIHVFCYHGNCCHDFCIVPMISFSLSPLTKVTSQANELHTLQVTNTELKSKLTMSELLTQQLSAETPTSGSNELSNQLDELRSEVVRLERMVRSVSEERDQTVSDLDALRDIMIQQQQDSTNKVNQYTPVILVLIVCVCVCVDV